jgi:uncharacterized protein
MRIGLLSDTHSHIHHGVLDFLQTCKEIWHCGDIGSMEVINQLKEIAYLRAVHGNIDHGEIVHLFPEYNIFELSGQKVLMMHIGGSPGKYSSTAKNLIVSEKPNIFVCGHSHILKIMYDKHMKLLFMNPGAAGKFGCTSLSLPSGLI